MPKLTCVRFALPCGREARSRRARSAAAGTASAAMDYAEEQENELMMLESMYMEDFVKLVRRRAA